MQIQTDFMARFKKNNTAKNPHVCQVEKQKAKEERNGASSMKRGLDMSCMKKISSSTKC